MLATGALLGFHTFHGTVVETELNIKLIIPVCCLAAMNLSAFKNHWWKDVAAVSLTAYSIFANELGLLVWVCIAAAYLVGCRGVSRTGVAGSTLLLAVYFILRFGPLDVGAPILGEARTGFGFSIYRKFKDSFPGALRPTSSIVGRGAVKDAAVPRSDASGDDLRRPRSLRAVCGTSHRPSTNSSTLAHKRLQPCWPESRNAVSGEPGGIHSDRAPVFVFS